LVAVSSGAPPLCPTIYNTATTYPHLSNISTGFPTILMPPTVFLTEYEHHDVERVVGHVGKRMV
jgi:hypothetical protein